MANNADSLVLLDIAHDIWSGRPLYGWNFPRVLYIFPDLVIALFVMAPGWLTDLSLLAIAAINFSLLTLFVQRAISVIGLQVQPSLLKTTLLISASLALLAGLFPFAMSNIYWQIFASGAHFLSVILVAYIFILIPWDRSQAIAPRTKYTIVILVFLAALSNSMSALLMGIMIVTRWGWGLIDHLFFKKKTSWIDFLDIGVLLGISAGVLLGAQVPRQSMSNSFFSWSRFQYAFSVFEKWLSISWVNGTFLLTLLLCTCGWVLVSTPFARTRAFALPKTAKAWFLVLRNPSLFPALSIFVAAPMFYQEITRSLRYYAFPALLTLLTVCVVLWTLWIYLLRQKNFFMVGMTFLLGVSMIALVYFQPDQLFIPDDALGKDLPNYEIRSQQLHTEQAVACIDRAKSRYQLQDGIAMFWNARPVRFASHFKYYLAQVDSWRPRSGYFVWGNNAMDFLYADSTFTQTRYYNYILTTKNELARGLWGSILSKAISQIDCQNYTLFVYADDQDLKSFLFPWGIPRSLDGNGRQNERHLMSKAPDPLLTHQQDQALDLLRLPAIDLYTEVGNHQDSKILAKNRSGFLVYGPYLDLPAGYYVLTVYGDLKSSDNAAALLDVAGNGGVKIIATASIALPNMSFAKKKHTSGFIVSPAPSLEWGNPIAQIEFDLIDPLREAEFRIQVPSTMSGYFSGYSLKRQINLQK